MCNGKTNVKSICHQRVAPLINPLTSNGEPGPHYFWHFFIFVGQSISFYDMPLIGICMLHVVSLDKVCEFFQYIFIGYLTWTAIFPFRIAFLCKYFCQTGDHHQKPVIFRIFHWSSSQFSMLRQPVILMLFLAVFAKNSFNDWLREKQHVKLHIQRPGLDTINTYIHFHMLAIKPEKSKTGNVCDVCFCLQWTWDTYHIALSFSFSICVIEPLSHKVHHLCQIVVT